MKLLLIDDHALFREGVAALVEQRMPGVALHLAGDLNAARSVLAAHPGVADIAVIGVPDPKWGETPLALVVLRDGVGAEVDGDALIAFCRERLAHFKCPRRVERVDALPRTATGKLQKFKLRDAWWQGDRRVQ